MEVQGAGESRAALVYSTRSFGLRPLQPTALKQPAAVPPSDSWISLSEWCMEAFPGNCRQQLWQGEAASQTGLFSLLPWDEAEVESLKNTRPKAHVPALK